MTGEAIERVKNSRLPYRVIGRNRIPDKVEEWFVDDPDHLPAGVFVAGPFSSFEDAEDALEIMNASAAIAAMREPTEAMGAAMLLARTYFEDMGNNPRLTEAAADKLRMSDHLAGNPSRWCMPDWRAGMDQLTDRQLRMLLAAAICLCIACMAAMLGPMPR